MDAPELPRTAVWVARAQLAAVALVALVALAGGLAMQVELWSPGSLWSKDFYSSMLGLHGLATVAIGAPAIAGSFGYVAVSHLVGARRVAAPAIAWIALAFWVIGTCVTAYVLARSDDSGWTFYTPYSIAESPSRLPELVGPLALAGAAVLYAIHLATIIAAGAHTAAPAKLAIAAAFVLAIAVAGVASMLHAIANVRDAMAADPIVIPRQHAFDVWSAPATAATLVATLVLATATLIGKRGAPLALIAISCGALWAFAPMLVTGVAVIGLWIALAVLGGFGRSGVGFVVFGCAPAIAILGLARLLASGDDLHLHDTHFAIGTQHLLGAIVAFAGLATLHAFCRSLFGRAPHAFLAWIGVVTTSAGTLLHVFAALRTGARGMPRRYWDYDPDFTAGHQLALIGAGILVAGLIVLGIAWLVGDRRLAR